MKNDKIREMSDAELRTKVEELKREQYTLRLQSRSG